MPKFTNLERRIIRAAYASPEGSEERKVFREVLAVHFETEKEWETYREKHPDTDIKNHTFEFKDEKDPEKEEEGDENSEGDEDEIGSKAEGEKLQKAKEVAQKVFDKGWGETKKQVTKLKGKFDKLKSEVNEDRSETLGELAELMTAMMSAVFTTDSAFLDSVMGRLEAKKEEREKVQNAIATMKAAELAAIADEDLEETLLDNGVDVLSDTEREELEQFGQVLRGEVENDDEVDAEVRKKLFDRLTDMDDDRIELLQRFVKDGIFDLDAAKAFFVAALSPGTPTTSSDEDSSPE